MEGIVKKINQQKPIIKSHFFPGEYFCLSFTIEEVKIISTIKNTIPFTMDIVSNKGIVDKLNGKIAFPRIIGIVGRFLKKGIIPKISLESLLLITVTLTVK
jgi:hypothetical protein